MRPRGKLYCGAELADNNFRLGSVTRGLTTLFLRLLSRYVGPGMSYSFGGKDNTTKDELPHISFPLKTAMENVVVTRAGSTPPSMGQPFVESKQSISERMVSSVKINDWNLDDTYSMSFTSSCVDLPTWHVLDPCSVNLSTFWGDSALRLVVYEKGGADNASVDSRKQENKYLLSLQVRHVLHACIL